MGLFKTAIGGCCCGVVAATCAEFHNMYFNTLGAPDVEVRIEGMGGGSCTDELGNIENCADNNTTFNVGPLSGPTCFYSASIAGANCKAELLGFPASSGVVSATIYFSTGFGIQRVIEAGLHAGGLFSWRNVYPSEAAVAADASILLGGGELELPRNPVGETNTPCTRQTTSKAYLRFAI